MDSFLWAIFWLIIIVVLIIVVGIVVVTIVVGSVETVKARNNEVPMESLVGEVSELKQENEKMASQLASINENLASLNKMLKEID